MATPHARLCKKVERCFIRCRRERSVKLFYFKVYGNKYQRAGVADYVACVHGLWLSVEVKAGRDKPSGVQQQVMKEIVAAGGRNLVIREDTVHRLEDMLLKTKAIFDGLQ